MAPSVEALEGYIKEATRQLYDTDPNAVTVNLVRQRAEEQNGLEKGFFVTPDWKARSKTLITEFVQTLDSPPSTPELKTEEDTKHGVKRCSSDDEASASPSAKRQKKATSGTAAKNSRLKKESSSSALSELADSDVEPKKEKNKKTKAAKKSTKQESDSELSDPDSSEEEPKQKKKAKKPAASRKAKKEESESELSDLSSLEEDKPKPTKKRGHKSKKLEDSDDGERDNKAGVSKLPSKRKQPAVKTKRAAKRGKVESGSEDELNGGNKVEKNEDDADAKTDENITAKAGISEEDTKPETMESKPLADDSDSSLSSVLDEPPPKKRKGKDAKGASKPKQSTTKEVTGDEAEIKKLQGQLVKCGVRKIWGIELKKFGSDGKAKIRHLRTMLQDVGMDGRFSEAKAREIKERRELIGELEAVNEMNELWGLEGRHGRASRSKAPRKSLKEESDEGNGDDGGEADDDNIEHKPKAEDDDEDTKGKTTSRMSKRMADLAFLGSDSESE